MKMFKDKYKEVHNEIGPDKELLQKVIAAADAEIKNNIKVKKINFYPYLYAAAAVLLLVASQVAYTALKPQEIIPNNQTNTVVQNNNEIKKIQESFEADEKPIKSETPVKKAQEQKAPVKNTVLPEQENNKASLPDEKTEKTEKIEENTEVTTENLQVVWNINNISHENQIQSRAVPMTISENFEEEMPQSVYEEITAEEYKAYIGLDITNIIDVPEDMTLYPKDDFLIEKNAETLDVINDENTYYYEASFDRFIMVTTSKSTDEHESFLNNESYEKSVIDGENVVVTFDENIYNIYLITNETGIKITAGKTEEKELQNTIKSLFENEKGNNENEKNEH